MLATVSGAGELAAGYDPDFMIFEEVDLKATRSYHVDEYELLDKYFGGYYSDFAINYDSAFLMVPPGSLMEKAWRESLFIQNIQLHRL